MCGARHRSGKRVSWANLDQIESHLSIWDESQHRREVSWNLEDDEGEGTKFILRRSRKVKKEDWSSGRQKAKKGKVGGEDNHLYP